MVNSRGYLIALLIVSLGFRSAAALAAQSTTLSELTFCVYSQDAPRGIKFLPEPDEDAVELSFRSSQRSKSYSYRGNNPIVFFTEVEVPPDPNRPNSERVQRVPVGYVSIPSGLREAFFLFSAEGNWGANSIPRYVVSVFDDSLNSFPLGHAVFLNATGIPLFGRLGNRDIGVPGGLSQPFAIGEGETRVNLAALANGEQVSVYSDVVPLGRSQRVTILLLPPYSTEEQQIQRRFLFDPNKQPAIKRPRVVEGIDAGG